MYERPSVMASTFRASRSMPVAWNPALAELDGERQSDVAEADDAGSGAAGLDFLEKTSGKC